MIKAPEATFEPRLRTPSPPPLPPRYVWDEHALIKEYTRYTLNSIPIRMIHIPTMKLVGRSFVRNYFGDEERIKREFNLLYDREQTRILGNHGEAMQYMRGIVKYAIFSHRWLNEGEPTYQEISGKNGLEELIGDPSRPGYRKLLQFCKEADRLGLEFAWTDTCCIDKSSSAELDESIRSMFRWYQHSTVCIVHLAQTTSVEDLHKDEWLERGWTLQELLAPDRIKFYNKTWEPLADLDNDKGKDSPILVMIEKATAIPSDALRCFKPEPKSVDHRMTWAAKRITTREEDMAYSLMGIFDVSLQIAYGEGADRAFARLIEAIMQAGGDASVLNWTGFPADHHSSRALPASSASYVGHPHLHDADQLEMALTSRGLRVPLVVLPLNEDDEFNIAWDYQHTAHVNFKGDGEESAKFHCSHLKIGDVSITAYFKNAIGGLNLDNDSQEFALGIINYRLSRSSRSGLAVPKRSVAYLLHRQRGRGSAQIGNGWEKMTTDYISLKTSGASNIASYVPVTSKYLEIVYL